MSLSINVQTDIDRITRWADEMQRNQIPFATALAITKTAKSTQDALKKTLQDTFDQPSPYITRGTFSTRATKRDPSALVGMKDKAARGASPALYVRESFAGGARGAKPFELAFQQIGALPAGMRAVPGPGMKLDRSGSPNRKTLKEIIGAIRAGMRVYAGRGRNAQQLGYFVVTPERTARTQKIQPGIYRRTGAGRGSKIVPVFFFVQEAVYEQVIDLEQVTNETVSSVFQDEFRAALERATATAR